MVKITSVIMVKFNKHQQEIFIEKLVNILIWVLCDFPHDMIFDTFIFEFVFN